MLVRVNTWMQILRHTSNCFKYINTFKPHKDPNIIPTCHTKKLKHKEENLFKETAKKY